MRSERNPVQILHLHLGLHTDLRGQVCFHGSLLGITNIPVEAITPPGYCIDRVRFELTHNALSERPLNLLSIGLYSQASLSVSQRSSFF